MIPLTLLGDLAPVGLTDLQLAAQAPQLVPGLALANLEVPFCAASLPRAPKAGPALRADPTLLATLAAIFPGFIASLANNHTLDHGPAGLRATLASAHALGLRTVGAGPDLAAASTALILDHNGLRVGFLSVTDRWFGLAAADRAGVAPLGFDTLGRIRRLHAATDRVIVSIHGGSEVSPWPAPRWQETLRALAEAGAHVVHAHHPHVPLGWERWANAWIFYGLGNTVVHPALWPVPAWTRRSWRVTLDLAALAQPPHVSAWEIASLGENSAELRCQAASVSAADPIVRELNAPLGEPLLLEALHQEYAVRLWESFYADRLNLSDTPARRARAAARLLRDSALALARPGRWRTLRRDRGLFHHHLFSAATHADEIATALGLLHGELPDRRDPRSRALAATWLPATLFAS